MSCKKKFNEIIFNLKLNIYFCRKIVLIALIDSSLIVLNAIKINFYMKTNVYLIIVLKTILKMNI